MDDITIPPTEVEIALILDVLPSGKDIMRRLVFQRDSLLADRDKLREAAQTVVNSQTHQAKIMRCEPSFQVKALAALLVDSDE